MNYDKKINVIKKNYVFIYSPISDEILFNLSIFLLINTMLSPRLANSLAYSFPMPSVDPVTTATKLHVQDYIKWYK